MTSSNLNMTPMNNVSLNSDPDIQTDEVLGRESRTMSKGTIKRVKRMMSTIIGDKHPSRAKVFEDSNSNADIRLWKVEGHDKTIHCARVLNPALLRAQGTSTKRRATMKLGTAKQSKDFATEWAQLAQVERLEIEDSESVLTELPKRIATDLRHLTSLTVTWTRVRAMPVSIFSLPLRTLYIQRNCLRNINGIENAINLSTLDVSNNQVDTLPKSFGNLANLVAFNIAGNNLRELPASVGNLRQLKTFDCSCNKLRVLPDTVCNLLELSSLDISANNIASLPASIGCLPSLTDLRARSNSLRSLPDSFRQLTTLQSLLLRKNCFDTVPSQLAALKGLQNLNLRENQISRFDVVIPSLRTLILDYNALTSVDQEILACSLLHILSVQYNQLGEIPSEISQLSNLNSLHLSGNQIPGLPASLAQLTSLRHLSMNETCLREFPKCLLAMAKLTQIDLDDCDDLDSSVRHAHRKEGLPGIRKHFETLEANKNENNNDNSFEDRPNHQEQLATTFKNNSDTLNTNNDSKNSLIKAIFPSVVMRTKARPPSSGSNVINNTMSIFPVQENCFDSTTVTSRESDESSTVDSTQALCTEVESDAYEMKTLPRSVRESVMSDDKLVVRQQPLRRTVMKEDGGQSQEQPGTKRETFRGTQSNYDACAAIIECLDSNLDMHDDNDEFFGKTNDAGVNGLAQLSSISEAGDNSASTHVVTTPPPIAKKPNLSKIASFGYAAENPGVKTGGVVERAVKPIKEVLESSSSDTVKPEAKTSQNERMKPSPPAVKPKPAR